MDVGCGDATDAEIFVKEFNLDVYGIDVYKHENVDKLSALHFQQADIFTMPYEDNSFDYVFLHDVLHHIDEKSQSYERHIQGLREIQRITRKNGSIIIIEGNRYNPLFYPHMVKIKGHNHFKQSYFKQIINITFCGTEIKFKYFECHVYPKYFLWFWKIYELIMEKLIPVQFLAYNVAVIKK